MVAAVEVSAEAVVVAREAGQEAAAMPVIIIGEYRYKKTSSLILATNKPRIVK